MPGIVEILAGIYANSGPALQVVFLVVIVLGWRHEVEPRLDALEDTQEAHDDALDEKALNAQERDLLLDDAHDRLDRANDARQSLRARLRSLEHEVVSQHDNIDLDFGRQQRQRSDD